MTIIRRRGEIDCGTMQPHLVVPGSTMHEICEAVFQYTVENPTGDVFVDLNNFDDLGVSKILCLINELRAVERFVNPEFEGKLTVFNASWALGAAISAVYNTVIYHSAPKATFKLA